MRLSCLFVALAIVLGVESLSAQTKISHSDVCNAAAQYVAEQQAALNEASDSQPIIVYRKSNNIQDIRWRHNLRVSIGVPSLITSLAMDALWDVEPDVISDPGRISDRLASSRYYDSPTYFLTNVALEYGYAIKSWLHIGAKAAFAGSWSSSRHIITDQLHRRNNNYFTAAVTNVRFEWLRRNNVQLYSSIGVGVQVIIYDYDTEVYPIWDHTFIGCSFGRAFYGFVELGGGASGSLRAGIGYRFNGKK